MLRPSSMPAGGPNNTPLLVLRHDNLTVEGYSVAAIQTYWRIPELHISFDHGAHPIRFTNTQHIAISHTHSDHVAGLPALLTTREIQHLPPTQVFVPEPVKEQLQQLLDLWQVVTDDSFDYQLIAARPGERYPITDQLFLEPFPTIHTLPSVGYLVGEIVHKLLPAHHGCSQQELDERRQQGVTLTAPEPRFHACYLGDSGIKGLLAHPACLSARILIMEVTYYDDADAIPEPQRSAHVHIDDVVAMADQFNNEIIVFGHASARYSTEHILDQCRAKLPEHLQNRLVVWA